MDWLTALVLAGAVVIAWLAGRGGWRSRGRGWSAAGQRGVVTTDPPELAWVARANGALAAWLRRGEGGSVSAIVLDRRVGEALHGAVMARLATGAGPEDRAQVERLDEGVLAYVAADDVQVALLLPAERGIPQARKDLALLVGVIRGKAAMRAALAEPAGTEESLRGLATHLAFEVERLVDAEVAVAIRRPRGTQIIATSATADPHLHRRYAIPGSPVDLVTQGRASGMAVAYDPIGNLPADRRRRDRQAFVFAMADVADAAIGAVVVWTRDGAEPAGEPRGRMEALIRAAGPRLSGALERLELRDRAMRDPLTGLLNRRGLEERMALVTEERGALLVCDLDHFKRLNDTLGHPAGDSALRLVASVIEDAVRGQDAAARVGGEEFAVWMPGAGTVEAMAVAERLRARVADLWWTWQGRSRLLSISIGVAVWPETTRSRDNLLAQADAALYRAKEGGRNRVEASGHRSVAGGQ